MKMKRIILGILVAVIMLVAMTPMTNAATFSIDAKDAKYEVGDKVVVTVNVNPTRNIDITLNYDKDVFSIDSVDAIAANSQTGAFKPTVNKKVAGVIEVSGADADEDLKIIGMKFTFIANKEADSAVFTASGLVTEVAETLNSTTKTVKVVKKSEEPTKPAEPENPNKPSEPTEPTTPNTPDKPSTPTEPTTPNKPSEPTTPNTPTEPNNAETPKTETKQEQVTTPTTQSGNSNKIQKPTKLPQTGVPFVAIGLVLVAIVAGAVLVSTNKKLK